MPKIKVLGVEFPDKEAAIHWLEVGLRLNKSPAEKKKLMAEYGKLKGTKSK
jgi:hypothetical protein